jgi:hypothetical protein
MVPEFAILGHPNEGKSSVLSTLAEDDSVRISPIPGETSECRAFPVFIDNREIIRFIDTPGFQNPARVLSLLQKKAGSVPDPLVAFRREAGLHPELHDDCELLGPLEKGAGIIYVVDGSRPVRNVDRAEMAIINCKGDNRVNLQAWKNEFRKNFNLNREFNAHRATYAERIHLLEALKSIDQEWQQPLTLVVEAFRKDWAARNCDTAAIITSMLRDCLGLKLERTIRRHNEVEKDRENLFALYKDQLNTLEQKAHQRIRSLFKHNIFNYELPAHSILREDLFDARGWQLFGLSKRQVAIAGGLGGAAIGAGIEMATLGHGLGIFTAVGSVAGAVGALLGGESISNRVKAVGLPFGGESLQIGPARSIDLLFVLLNRSLLYYEHTINWAHGRRDYLQLDPTGHERTGPQGYTRNWPAKRIRICHDFFKWAARNQGAEKNGRDREFYELVLATLKDISESS